MFITVSILFIVSCTTLATSDWTYTTQAYTVDGRPCMSDCNTKCIVDWFGYKTYCNATNKPAPKYRTVETDTSKQKYCLSNCGFFGLEYEWCVITNDKKWDYCNSGTTHVSIYKNKCKENCDKHLKDYYWCHVEGGSWQYCALPREGGDQDEGTDTAVGQNTDEGSQATRWLFDRVTGTITNITDNSSQNNINITCSTLFSNVNGTMILNILQSEQREGDVTPVGETSASTHNITIRAIHD